MLSQKTKHGFGSPVIKAQQLCAARLMAFFMPPH